ncbi:diguanylate cyclase/phosphodiesterase (GGDEF & EAL domains) with PAS/PAC sensor(s) [hydrothermal vent metagenome]|uniref:Diguanylate cyclase/phosphodiesterase (GGDEF & EAL domains) with PAS/PAC sensor(S) n=1 Tax=hydrothermal vent metagenome TaxID=652676 RepID=A0A3B1B752_9ZZZZ
MQLTAEEFQTRFLRLIALTWLLPPLVGLSFLLYIEIFSIEQVINMMSTPPKPIFLLGGIVLALWYFNKYSKLLTAYLHKQDDTHKQITETALRKFPWHYWSTFILFLMLAPAVAILSLEMSSNYIAQPVDWFRISLVALIVSIIVGLPIFISIYNLFGRAFGQIHLQRPLITIKTKVFLIGALTPLLIDTMLVQYYWTRTGYFTFETFIIWLLLECLAIAGALLFVRSFMQSLMPLKSLIHSPAITPGHKIQSNSTDELGIFANQLVKLLDEQQLHQERLSFSNELLKASHSHESLALLLETIVNKTCKTLKGDICFLNLYQANKNKLVCVANSNAGYKASGHFQISLEEDSINVDVFKSSKPRVIDDISNSSHHHTKLKKALNLKSSAAVPLIADTKIIGVLQIANSKEFHHYDDHEIKILQAFAQEAAVIQTFFEDLKLRRKAETAITQIMEAVSTTTGTDFFKAMTIRMAEILQADSCGVVSMITEDNETVETLAYYYDGNVIDNTQYPLQGTPCETIIGKQTQTYASNVQNTFPQDAHLCDTNMESYVGIPLFDSHDKPLGLLFAMFRDPIEDISFNESVMRIFAARTVAEIERTQTEEKIKHMAYYDDLTQLPNRAYLMDRLQQAISHAKRKDDQLAVIILDIDHFKKINDSLGHQIGDGLLVEVAQRLQQCLRNEDTVARLGGDEFVLLLSGFDTSETTINYISNIATELNQKLKEHYYISDHNLMITSSCGIAIYPDDGESAELLIKHADTAMYSVKENGRNNYQFFTREMNSSAMERLEMESAIHQAIIKQQFEVAYQPKVAVEDNKILGAELLLRWNHPDLGYISPDRFIPIANETGQIIQLGDFIFQQACIQASELWCKNDSCEEITSLSVNVSPRQFLHDDFIDKIKQNLEKYQTNPSCLELEVTENILIEDTKKVCDKLQSLKKLGFKISIDDFGTGYASLRYLQQLPIDMIKIDRSFINHICENQNDLAIVKTIMTMAENLNINVIAEGVETKAQLKILAELGCKSYQGYLFSKAINKKDFTALVKKQNAVISKKSYN